MTAAREESFNNTINSFPWDHSLKCLRDDDVPHSLDIGHPQRSGCFHLPPVNGLNAPTEDFGDIRSGIQR